MSKILKHSTRSSDLIKGQPDYPFIEFEIYIPTTVSDHLHHTVIPQPKARVIKRSPRAPVKTQYCHDDCCLISDREGEGLT
ncbi:hypothetical protein CDAR_590541 [Caerostris darwini]|uniref:Uncharacterized protein n=1 Tax=Caerostris darwini TaxID=1538125 RepID=A0AAV4TT78_9ARAC|nr:hypothetical protein CDAR_590541 [Caerostris darwini]